MVCRYTNENSNGWGASAIDALSTALIMGKSEIVNQIVNYVPDIDWSVSADDQPVSLFETTIRYVAGLLSGYDLLKGPLSDLCEDVSVPEPDYWNKMLILGSQAKWTRSSSRQ
jgi:mannosyl-oligosaccharide alpha-1,2-mannosidase